MKRYLQEKFELNHNLTEARLAVLRGAIEMLEKMEHFFTHEHLTKKGEPKICYQSTIDDFIRKNPASINNTCIRGWFYIDSRWQTLHFCEPFNPSLFFEFTLYEEKGSFIVDKKINLDMIEEARNYFKQKLESLKKHIKTREALEAQLLNLADDMATKSEEISSVLDEWNMPMNDISKFVLVDKIKLNLYR